MANTYDNKPHKWVRQLENRSHSIEGRMLTIDNKLGIITLGVGAKYLVDDRVVCRFHTTNFNFLEEFWEQVS